MARYDLEALRAPQSARRFLKEYLSANELGLFLGAGVSQAVGLPGWKVLARRVGLLAGLSRITSRKFLADKDYPGLVDEARRKIGDSKRFEEIVHAGLYRRFRTKGLMELCQTPILISLGSLVSGGNRGRVTEVVSLNFDDVLEFYLSMHGLSTQAIGALPELIDSNAVQVTHAHGFLPYFTRHDRSRFLVFSRKDSREVLAGSQRLFRERMEQVLLTKICIFVGMSAETATDAVFSSLLEKANRAIRRKRPTGVWLFRRPEGEDVAETLKECGVAAVHFDTYEEIAEFLLLLCQSAGRDLRSVVR